SFVIFAASWFIFRTPSDFIGEEDLRICDDFGYDSASRIQWEGVRMKLNFWQWLGLLLLLLGVIGYVFWREEERAPIEPAPVETTPVESTPAETPTVNTPAPDTPATQPAVE